MKNRILLVVLLIIIGITLLIGFGLFGMGIEDKYGELQDVYYKSKNDDLIVNKNSKKIGKIYKTWKDISVITKEKDTFDLWYWENTINKQSSKIYRPKNKIEIQKLSYSKIQTLIKNNKLKLIIDCKVKPNEITEQVQSNFNLEKDYAEFQTKMTEQDTIKVWTAITSCMYQVVEKLTITKKGSYITISPEIKESLIKDVKFNKQIPITISENDTIWKFGSFMKKYSKRITTEKDSIGRFYIKCHSRKFHFTTKKMDNEFLSDYCSVMKHLYPKSKYYFFEEIEIVK